MAELTDFILVLTATSTQDEAQLIADKAVDKQLAAAVQIIGPVTSVYTWKGQKERSQEWVVQLKTRQDLYSQVEELIRSHHSYVLPGILAIPIVAGSTPYFQWFQEHLLAKKETLKEPLLQALNEAHKQLIAAAIETQNRLGDRKLTWGPREVLAHIMGWEAEATARIPMLATGEPPVKYIDDTFNAAVITAIGNQSFDDVCHLLRQTHRHLINVLSELDDGFFTPEHPIGKRVRAMTAHSLEHAHGFGYMG